MCTHKTSLTLKLTAARHGTNVQRAPKTGAITSLPSQRDESPVPCLEVLHTCLMCGGNMWRLSDRVRMIDTVFGERTG